MASSTQPINTLRQPIRLSNPAADTVSKTLIRCLLDSEVLAGTLDPMDERLRYDPHWHVIELPSNHMAPVANPALVAEALLGIVERLKKTMTPEGQRAGQARPTGRRSR